MNKIKQKVRECNIQSNGGCGKSWCDICNNTDFYKEAVENIDPNQGYMLNLCDDCRKKLEPDIKIGKEHFNEEAMKQRQQLGNDDNFLFGIILMACIVTAIALIMGIFI